MIEKIKNLFRKKPTQVTQQVTQHVSTTNNNEDIIQRMRDRQNVKSSSKPGIHRLSHSEIETRRKNYQTPTPVSTDSLLDVTNPMSPLNPISPISIWNSNDSDNSNRRSTSSSYESSSWSSDSSSSSSSSSDSWSSSSSSSWD